ncbi:MAG: DUF58 domain-containing protein [bacterium]|nr:DUF58 domain-containing protein [bacterium]
MKTTQRRPSPAALVVGGALWSLALAVEGVGLVQGAPLVLGAVLARTFVLAVVLLAGLALFVDLFLLDRVEAPRFRRALPRSLSLEAWSDVGVELRTRGFTGSRVELIDGVPTSAEVSGLPLALDPERGELQRAVYRVRPLVRGDVVFEAATFRAHTPLGFWRYTARLGEPASIRVYPNFAATTRFDELVQAARTRDVGIKRQRLRGEGLEFHQLREYRAGDSIRQIDWKATSRKRELISREYEAEHDQRIVFLLDCSRRMRTKDGDLSHFDHGLNAMILLAHVALKGGDAVGLLSFGEERRWTPPAKGAATVSQLLHRVYDLEPTTLGVDFRGAAEELGRHQRRRSMVILLTHLRPEDEPDVLPALRLLRRRHFVLVADLHPIELDERLARDPEDLGEAFTALGAWDALLDRKAMHDRLRAEGIRTLDVSPATLGPALVSRYFDAKRGGGL